jgi:hypothetical protein
VGWDGSRIAYSVLFPDFPLGFAVIPYFVEIFHVPQGIQAGPESPVFVHHQLPLFGNSLQGADLKIAGIIGSQVI